MAKDKPSGHKTPRSGTSRVKSLQREHLELETDLERARKRRDKAQARLEALEAIAEQLGSAIQSAEAADEARVARKEAAAAAAMAANVPSAPSNAADMADDEAARVETNLPPPPKRPGNKRVTASDAAADIATEGSERA